MTGETALALALPSPANLVLLAMAVYALVAWLLTRIVQLVLNRTVTSSRRDFS